VDHDQAAEESLRHSAPTADRAVGWIAASLMALSSTLWTLQPFGGRNMTWRALVHLVFVFGLGLVGVLSARGVSRRQTSPWLVLCGAGLIAAWALVQGGLQAPFLVLLPLLPVAAFVFGGRASWLTAAGIVGLLAGLALVEWLPGGVPSAVSTADSSPWAPALWLGLATVLGCGLTSVYERRTAKASHTLQVHAINDHLTGLANRRRFDAELVEECRRAARRDDPLAVILLDVDSFKGFNDTYGHPHGDRCLVAVSYAVSTCARRAGDLLARFGGEEFVALLPNTNHQQALHIAESMRQAVRQMEIPHPGSAAKIVTISLGVAAGTGAELEPDALLQAADRALYRAKEAGRDRVEAAAVTAAATAGLAEPAQ
jgi:diguanylate cyclase (GGDEF)-like protein